MAATAGIPSAWPLVDDWRPIPATVMMQSVTPPFVDGLDVTPLLGRTCRPEDDVVSNVKVISERLWRNRFGADPGIIGRPIRFSSPTLLSTIVGVVPDSAQVLGTTDVWEVIGSLRSTGQELRGSRVLQVIARLKSGVTIGQARADMAVVSANIERAAPATNRGWGTTIEPLQQAIVGDDLRTTSLLLGAVVLFVLLLACANIANLILARGLARTREIAVRAALGGSRGRIARQLLTESVCLGVLGGGAGLALSWVILRVAPSLIPAGTVPPAIALRVDWRVAAFAALATIATSLLFGLAPAWQAARVPLVEAMTGGRGATDRAGRTRQALAVLEIAAALLLTTGAGLLVRTLVSLNNVDAGYRADRIVTMTLKVPFMRIRAQRELAGYFLSMADAVATTPGVRGAAIGTDVPLAGTIRRQPFEIVGDPAPDQANRPSAHYQMIGPGYFEVLGVPLRRGRTFTPQDTGSAPQVCIVNEEFARRHFGGRDVLSAHIIVPSIELPPRRVTREIVGVIAQIKTRPDEPLDNALEVYVPLAQNTTNFATLVVRATANPMVLMPSIQKAIARLDRAQAVSRVRTMEDIASEATARPRFRAQLVGVFAGFAVVLAVVGTFSVLTFMVQQRTREFSLRRALGATTSDVLRLVFGNGARIIIVGIGMGLALSAALVRSLAGLLFGVAPLDPVTFVGAPTGLAVAALRACVAPAVRALRADPAVTLREQ